MKIYIAGPYGRRAGQDEFTCLINVLKAIDAGRTLISLGHNPFIPHLFHYVHREWDDTPNEDMWLEICLAWVEDCDALLRLSGDSSGANREMERAKELSLPIYFSIEELRSEGRRGADDGTA